MKNIFYYIVIACCFCSIWGGCSGFPSEAEQSIRAEDLQEVRSLEEDWMRALVQNDTANMSKILSEDFVLSGSNEKIETRAQYLQTAAMQDRELQPLALADRDLRAFPETVISTGRTIYSGAWKGSSFQLPVRYTHVFVKINGSWKAVAAHISMID